jgi:hypothetical protein
MITVNQAKKIIKAELDQRGLPYAKVTGHTVGFSDLLRCDVIFVKIHGWQSSPVWNELKRIAVANDFRIESDGIFSG